MTHSDLIAAAFHRGPLFRSSKFDAHVKEWRKFIQEEVYVLYHNARVLKTRYDAVRNAERAETARFFGKLPMRSAA